MAITGEAGDSPLARVISKLLSLVRTSCGSAGGRTASRTRPASKCMPSINGEKRAQAVKILEISLENN